MKLSKKHYEWKIDKVSIIYTVVNWYTLPYTSIYDARHEKIDLKVFVIVIIHRLLENMIYEVKRLKS